MTTIILFHLLRAAIVLAVLYLLVVLLLRTLQPSAAWQHRIAWSGVLVIPFFAMSLPLTIPVVSMKTEQSRTEPQSLDCALPVVPPQSDDCGSVNASSAGVS